ncbi:MAG: S8 family serine peptidase [Myxococcales bacterium]|nr:S8 family serine peptidase [Myxococcales bacterium]
MRLLISALAVSLAVPALAPPALAQLAPDPAPGPAGARPVLGARLRLLADQVQRYGARAPVFGPHAPAEVPEGAGVVLAAWRPLAAPEWRRLARLGVRFTLDADGAPRHLDARYPAWVPFGALPALAAEPLVARVETTWRSQTLRPLETVRAELGATRLQQRPDLGWTGLGVRIADIDGAVDVLHPHLFFADAGIFDWVDVDGDGRLTPGTDGVDLNGDGTIDRGERLQRLPAVRVNFYDGGQPQGLDGPFRPRRDWLYLDTNGSGERDAGPAAGYNEDTWAYGEPAFVAEDTDRDGAVAPGEPLHRLGTSKVVKATLGPRVYRRGGNPPLIEAARDPAAGDLLHGTGVASIAVGGQWPHHDAVGLAPDAEFLVYANVQGNEGLAQPFEASALLDALDEGAVAILHEWTDPFSQPTDGGGEVEAMMDSVRAQGLLQVSPLGNLNSAGKHLEVAAGPQSPVSAGFRVGPGFESGQGLIPYDVVYGLLTWRGRRGTPQLTVRAPNGAEGSPTLGGDPVQVGGAWVQAVSDTNRRGTHSVLFYVFGPEGQGSPLPRGEWGVSLAGLDEATTVYGRITDFYSSWGEGVGWLRPTTDRGTLVYPSSADSALGVAAYGGVHAQAWEGTWPGELRQYSGRGPRMDGVPAVDIAAPDDPFAALGVSPDWIQAGYGRTWFSTFGGTSGAGPHVAGVLALLAQARPDLDADGLEGALLAATRTDGNTPARDALPDRHWGYGKLDAWGLLSAEPRPAGMGVAAALDVRADGDEAVFDARGSEGPGLWYRFDADGDGRWDGAWAQQPTTRRALAALRPAVARVEVASQNGLRAGALAPYDPGALAPVAPEPDMAPPPPDMGAPGADGGVDPVDGGAGGDGGVNVVPVVQRGGGGRGVYGCAAHPHEPGPTPALAWLLLGGVILRRSRGRG